MTSVARKSWPEGTTRGTRQAAYMRRRGARQSRMRDAIKVTAGCIDCGYAENPAALQFDHVRGAKFKTIAQLSSWSQLWAEMEKCDVRCANCHAIRSAQQEVVRRGSQSA
jgi:hypothetical protein